MPRSPDFFRFGRVRYTRRAFISRSLLFGAGVATGVLGTLAEQYLYDAISDYREAVSQTEIVRGSLLGAFDEKGNLITNSLVPGSHLIMVVRELPAEDFAVRSVQARGIFKDFDTPPPVIAKVDGPNFGSNYLVVADLDAIQGGIPKNSPFQISYDVTYGGPGGLTGTKSNDPGPLQFTRV